MGFRDAGLALSAEDQEALGRARTPYKDHFLNQSGTPLPWNENPLLYAIAPDNPLKEPTDAEAHLVWLTSSYLYVCVFASNKLYPGGLHNYTNGADWALYFHPVQNPTGFSLGERRLYGSLHGGGYEWDRSAITLPIECNRYKLYDKQVDRSLVDGVTTLNTRGGAGLYIHPVRTFRTGTSDNHLWQREEDLPFIWGAIEQIQESDGIVQCHPAQQELQRWASALGLRAEHWMCLVRAVIGGTPAPGSVWNGNFRPGRGGGQSLVEIARCRGVQFSVLERALDELNFARNRMVHDGFVPTLDWNVVTLAFLGSRFWIALFKRILAWEGVRSWTQEDDCDVAGLQALAKEGQVSFDDGYTAYRRAVEECGRQHLQQRVLNHLERLMGPEMPA